mgnify:FL=1
MAEKQKVVIYSKLMSLLSGMVTNIKAFVASSIEKIPNASKTVRGMLKLGAGLEADSDGTVKVVMTGIEVSPDNIAKATKTAAGVMQVGSGLDVANGVVSVDNANVQSIAEDAADEKIAAQKFKTVNGQDIKGEGNIAIDLSLYKVVTELPTADIDPTKIYLKLGDANVPEGAQNTYIEYMYVNNKWEKVGEYKADIDLTPYAKTADVYTKDNPGEILDDVVNGLEDGSIDFAPMNTYLKGKYIDDAVCGNPGQTFVDKINEWSGSYVNTELDKCVKSADIEYMTDADVTSALATLFPAES